MIGIINIKYFLRLKRVNVGFILLILLLIKVSLVYPQESERYTFALENQSIKNIFKEIAEKTGFKFAYSDTELNSERVKSFNVIDLTISQIVDAIKDDFNVQAEIVGKNIVVKPYPLNLSYLVKGVVIDSTTNLPVSGVNVFNVDNLQGTITDTIGLFRMKVPSNQNNIRVSSIGFKTEFLTIKSDTTLRVVLSEEVKAIKELVVVAFGNESKDLVTGSVSVIRPSTYSQVNQGSVNNSLQTTSSGVFVQNNAGTPASSNNITIRGINSITAGTSPLYVVDGIPVITGNYSQLDFSGQTINAINDLNVNDIESISILKDAAASSLYGASSSNGVVLINTKRGSEKHNQIDFDSYYGLQETTGMLNMLNAKQWMTLVNEEAISAGNPVVYTDEQVRTNKIDTDWLKKIFRTSPTYNLYMSLRGGNEKSKYYISGNYFKQEGIIIGSDYNRYSFRVNYDYSVSNKLSIECGNSFSFSRNNRVEGDQSLNGPLPNAISIPPIYPVYNSDGSFNNDGPYANPVSIAKEEKNLALTYRNLFNASLIYRIANKLVLKSQFGVDYYNLGEQTFAPKGTRQGAKYNGLGIEATNMALTLNNSSYFTYDYSIAKHNFMLKAGASIQRYNRHGTYLRAQDFPGNSFEYLQDAATPIAANSNELDAVASSLFSQIKYNYADKYQIAFNLRRDYSSKFGKNNSNGYFPSIALLWYLSKESFFPSNPIVSKLKLSTSLGKTGNDQIPDFRSLYLFAAGSNYDGNAGISPYQLPNPNLKWESTTQFNLGLSLELFRKVDINVEYYYKKTKDLLFDKPLPASWGYRSIISNIGSLQNSGVEIEISSRIVSGKFNWDAALSISANKNKVLELYQDQPIRNIGRASSSIEVGMPVSYFYGLKALGVNKDDGMLIYKDLNKDGVINDLDKTKIGSPYPIVFGGFNSSFSFKSFTVSFLFYYSYGNDIFNGTRLYTETISIGNQTTAVLDRWKKPGDVTDVPKASSYNKRISSRFVEDGSFIRLKNIKLSYEFKDHLIKNSVIKSFQIYFTGKNLFTLTNYSGMDPEVNYNGSNSIVMGTDFFTCPQPKSYILGLCAKF